MYSHLTITLKYLRISTHNITMSTHSNLQLSQYLLTLLITLQYLLFLTYNPTISTHSYSKPWMYSHQTITLKYLRIFTNSITISSHSNPQPYNIYKFLAITLNYQLILIFTHNLTISTHNPQISTHSHPQRKNRRRR